MKTKVKKLDRKNNDLVITNAIGSSTRRTVFPRAVAVGAVASTARRVEGVGFAQ